MNEHLTRQATENLAAITETGSAAPEECGRYDEAHAMPGTGAAPIRKRPGQEGASNGATHLSLAEQPLALRRLANHLAKAVDIGPEVWRDRLADKRSVQPLKIARDGQLDAVVEARLGENIELAYVHLAATSLHGGRFQRGNKLTWDNAETAS